MRFVLDIETDGLLPVLSKVHSIVLRNVDTGDVISCASNSSETYSSIETGLDYITEATELIGHNLIKFDFPALQKIYPSLKLQPDCKIYDTLVTSRLFWPELESVDHARWSHIDKKYIGRHSLAAWGERLGCAKIHFEGETKETRWDQWTQSMQVYCEQDTLVSLKLYEYMVSQDADSRSLELEHEFAKVIAKQEAFGFPFNEKAAYALVNTLRAKRAEIDEQLQKVFPPVVIERWSEKTKKKLKDKVTVFNPASRQQTAERLLDRYPEIKFDKTEKGNVQVDDDVLESLGKTYPEAQLLAEYQLLNKRLGQIADGKEAWLKHCTTYGDGRIHGEVVTNACISGRCAHKRPNMGQVPSVGHAYGAECRALFYAPEGWTLVGADASGLELRALAAWLAYWDNGEYASLVSNPKSDIHTYNAELFGIYDKSSGTISKATRDLSKRLIYCILYGGGAKKTGSIIVPDKNEDQQYREGKKTIDTFYRNLPAIKALKDTIDKKIDAKGYLRGIDGRQLQIRSRHSALNQLLQSTGAIVVKKATCILHEDLTNQGLVHGQDYAMVAHIHDEYQSLVRPQYVEMYKELAINSFKKSGEYFNLKCPLTGEAKEGKNWMETH